MSAYRGFDCLPILTNSNLWEESKVYVYISFKLIIQPKIDGLDLIWIGMQKIEINSASFLLGRNSGILLSWPPLYAHTRRRWACVLGRHGASSSSRVYCWSWAPYAVRSSRAPDVPRSCSLSGSRSLPAQRSWTIPVANPHPLRFH